MASLNASGVPVVPKQLVGWRSHGRNIAVTSGTNVHQQASVRNPIVQGVPAYARASGDFGTQSTPAVESFLRQGAFVKHAESVDDTTVKTVLGTVPPSSGTQPEIALLDITTRRDDHRGNRVAEQVTDTDTIRRRVRNDSVRPGGEI